MRTSEYKQVEVRRATDDDAAHILAITKEAFEKYAFDLGKTELVHALNDTIDAVKRDIAEKTVYVALLEGETVGTIRFCNKADSAFISRFGVTLKAQSCGVGGALIRTVFDQAKEEGYKTVTLHTSSKMASLIRFYYGQGFYIRTTNTSRGYVRALLVKELEHGVDVDIEALCP